MYYKEAQEIKKQLTSKGYNVWGVFLHGSQNYGLETPTSDLDFKAFVIPSFKELFTGNKVSKVYETPYGQVEVKDIRMLPELIAKGNVAMIEILFSVTKLIASHNKEFEALTDGLADERSLKIAFTMLGMAREKNKNLTKRTDRNAEEIDAIGYEKKHLHHIIRLKEFLYHILSGGSFRIGLRPNDKVRAVLLDLKTEPIDLEEVLILVDQTISNMEKELNINSLPQPTTVYYNKLLELVERITYMSVQTKNPTSRIVKQTHAHYVMLPKQMKEFLEEHHPEVNKEHFVDIIEYIDLELVNHWTIYDE